MAEQTTLPKTSTVIPKARGKRGFKQGIFIPSNSTKCKNTTPVIYRSSFELKFNMYK